MTTQATGVEHPILFSSEMIRALLAGRKTATRRVVSPSNSTVDGRPAERKYWGRLLFDHAVARRQSSLMVVVLGRDKAGVDWHLETPYRHPDDPPEWPVEELSGRRVRPKWEVGDRLWCRETFAPRQDVDPATDPERARHYCLYKADDDSSPCDPGNWHDFGGKWKPSIFMPRALSRITLEIMEVRAERVNSITETDAIAEGVGSVAEYRELWDRLNGKKHPWDRNEWVWVSEFNRVDREPTS